LSINLIDKQKEEYDIKIANRFIEQSKDFDRTLITINNCFGYQISAFSCFPEESEVLLPPNTVLRIDKIFHKHGIDFIEMTQITGSELLDIMIVKQ